LHVTIDEMEKEMAEDRIEREIRIAAPIERVWAVVTESEHLGEWFGMAKPAEIDLRPGGIFTLEYGEWAKFPNLIVTVDAPHSFAYRSASAYPGVTATEENSTLVEFTLVEDGDGTVLRLVESGFESMPLPENPPESAKFESHANGWPYALDRVRQRAEDAAS
jgi:uncharacterized protein YndB with AHSA1/START domain